MDDFNFREPRLLFDPHPYRGREGLIGGSCLTCGGGVFNEWHQVELPEPELKEPMTPQEISAVATTLELIRKHPPESDRWEHPDARTLANQLQAWLKEQL